MAGRVRVTRVTAVTGARAIDVAEGAPGNAYGYGRLRWITGPNSGLDSPVLVSDALRLTLREPPPIPAQAGEFVEIAEGCDRRFATCVNRFANGLNFRGEPHLPGADLLTRYELG
jgi:uncharacterized phage protein (TIGR02218 family)